MKEILRLLGIFTIISFCHPTIVFSQPVTTLWGHCLGGTGNDQGTAIAATADNGTVAAGYTNSSDGDVENKFHGGTADGWIVKLDANGDTVWSKVLGGSGDDEFYGVTVDASGFIYAIGYSNSSDGDIHGNHSPGQHDMWVVKFNANGDTVQTKCFGGSGDDYGFGIAVAADGNIFASGRNQSSDGNPAGCVSGGGASWIIKLNSSLSVVWSKCVETNGGAYPAFVDVHATSDGGCIATGNSYGLSGNHGASDAGVAKLDAAGNIQWTRSLGGSDNDYGYTVVPSLDGGYLVNIQCASTNGDGVTNHGGTDVLLVKLDANGNTFWEKCFGGSGNEFNSIYWAGDLIQTPDHNFLCVNVTTSTDGDVSGGDGYYDGWIFKVDPLGNLIWQQVVLTHGEDFLTLTAATVSSDSSFVINGYGFGNSLSGYHGTGFYDFYTTKIKENPKTPLPIAPWKATLGGSYIDQAYDGESTADGGAIVCGTTSTDSNGDVGCVNGGFPTQWIAKVDAHGIFQHGECLIGGTAYSIATTKDGGAVYTGFGYLSNGNWSVIKLDALYNVQWDYGYGGNGYTPYSIQQINDGGYIVAGVKHWVTQADTIITDHGSTEFDVMKIDSSGNFLWEKEYGGSSGETAYSIDQTSDNGFVVAGYTASNNGNVTNNHGGKDAWVIKIDANGKLLWQKTIGGSKTDQANWVRQTLDGGYIVACETNSNDGDAVGNHGNYDFLIVKLDPSGNIVWKKVFGGTGVDKAHSVCQLSDGTYMAVGETASNNGNVSGNHGQSDYWVMKLDASGNLIWQHCFGGTANDIAESISPTSGGKVIVSGQTQSTNGDITGNHGNYDYWVLKFVDGNQVFYRDADDDGYGNPSMTTTGFFAPAGYVYNNLDCNDADASIHPGNVLDVCNGLDDNCNGVIDENGNYALYYKDADADGYGNIDSTKWLCSAQSGYVTKGGDCNDANASVHPGACEIYFNGIDEDCDGVADDCNAPPSGFSTTNITATSAKLNWSTLPCAVGYTVQYRKVGTTTFTTLNVNTNTGSKKITGLQSATNYEWQVRTKCHAGPSVFSVYSALQNFTTSSQRESQAENDFSIAEVNVFPNPAGSVINVQCSDWQGKAMITVFSVLGRVMIQKSAEAANNSLNETLDVSKLSAGTYILVIENNFEIGQTKFVK